MGNVEKGSLGYRVYGPHTQVKRLFKALVFLTCKQNISIYSQMRKSINCVSMGILETLR